MKTIIKKKAKKVTIGWNVISPDGFTIEREGIYPSRKAAIQKFKEWKKRYKHQGYYSSVDFGRIPLLDLEDYCQFIEITREVDEHGIIKRIEGDIPEDTSYLPDHSKPSCEECGSEDIMYLDYDEKEQKNVVKCNDCMHTFDENLM